MLFCQVVAQIFVKRKKKYELFVGKINFYRHITDIHLIIKEETTFRAILLRPWYADTFIAGKNVVVNMWKKKKKKKKKSSLVAENLLYLTVLYASCIYCSLYEK